MKKELNILFTSSWFPSKAHETLGNFVEKHARAVALYQKIHVFYITSIDGIDSLKHEVKREGNYNELIVYYKKHPTRSKIWAPIINWFKYHKAFKHGRELLEKEFGITKVDLIHHNIHFPAGIIPLYYKKHQNTPYIISENWTGFLPSNAKEYSGIGKKWLTRKIGQNCDIQCPVSEDLKKALTKHGLGKRFEIVPNVFSTSYFKLNEARKFDPLHPVFIHVSTLDEAQKNITGMLNAFKKVVEKIPGAHLKFVNDGSADLAKSHAKKLGILNEISFTGKQDVQGVADALYDADIFVLFSNYENLPCVVIEALAAGLPVVSSTAGGTPEHLSKDLGELVAPKDEKALTQKMLFVVENYDNYDREHLRNYALDNFSYEAVGKKFHAIYQKLLQ